jgi:hypothetical protein
LPLRAFVWDRATHVTVRRGGGAGEVGTSARAAGSGRLVARFAATDKDPPVDVDDEAEHALLGAAGPVTASVGRL